MLIASPDNPLVKRLLHCHDARGRRSEGLVLVEGLRLVGDCLAAGWTPVHLLVREGEAVPEHWPAPTTISARVAQRLSQAATASGYLAAFPLPSPARLDPALGGLVLAGIADPGNLGTLLRSAAAFGVRQVALAGGADPWSAKALQSTAGAVARLALRPGAIPQDVAGARLCALVVAGGRPPEALPRQPRWLVVGGEANGIPEEWRAVCAEQCTLPMPGGTESLNAAVAGSIALYLASRA
jgi:TrmH family RNA methyltransferase